MKKIIVEYFSGNDYFDNELIILCFLYDSSEKFLLDFEKILKDTYEKYNNEEIISPFFKLCKEEFCIFDFYWNKKIELPDVYDLEEWFDKKIKEREKNEND